MSLQAQPIPPMLWPEMRWSEESAEVPIELCEPAECKLHNP